MARLAVVLMSLGGPDSAAAVEPFLFNLFSDPAIIALAQSAALADREADLVATRADRAENLCEDRQRIAAACRIPRRKRAPSKRRSAATRAASSRCVIGILSPRAAARAVKQWGADEIVLLPLYPQFSSTTTASSFADWHDAAKRAGIAAPTYAVCCAPDEPGFIAALARNVESTLAAWPSENGAPRLLLSAHGLPKRTVARGDPYQSQVEMTAAALRQVLARPDLDITICYQSRVGPLEWLGPATDAEIRRAGAEKRGLIVAPIAFVSEHSETLVELDIEYRHLAAQSGVPHYVRVPTVGTAPTYIAGLARLVRDTLEASQAMRPEGGARRCAPDFTLCPCATA